MVKTLVEVHGFMVPIQYRTTEDFKIIWILDNSDEEIPEVPFSLLNMLLRMFFTDHILQQISDQIQAQIYEADAKATALAEDYL